MAIVKLNNEICYQLRSQWPLKKRLIFIISVYAKSVYVVNLYRFKMFCTLNGQIRFLSKKYFVFFMRIFLEIFMSNKNNSHKRRKYSRFFFYFEKKYLSPLYIFYSTPIQTRVARNRCKFYCVLAFGGFLKKRGTRCAIFEVILLLLSRRATSI